VRFLKLAVSLLALTGALSAQQPAFSPARLVRGDLPGVAPPNVIGGGEVFIEAIIDRTGALTRPVVLRSTPPFSQMVLGAIGGWRFTPAQAVQPDGPAGPVESSVLIVAMYRPPTLLNAAAAGEPPRDLSNGTSSIAYPVSVVAPPYPPQALMGSVVLFEVLLDELGRIRDARAIGSDPGFDSAARDAVLQWKFRPSSYRGRPAPSTAYVIFGFSSPVIGPGAPPTGAPPIPPISGAPPIPPSLSVPPIK
jgi:outer membrane biosynthesis protein TonB